MTTENIRIDPGAHGHTAPNAAGCCSICGEKVGDAIPPVVQMAPPPPAPVEPSPPKPEVPPPHGPGPKPMPHEHEPTHEPHDVPKGKAGWLGKGKK